MCKLLSNKIYGGVFLNLIQIDLLNNQFPFQNNSVLFFDGIK